MNDALLMLAPSALAYLVVCWADYCSTRVDPSDDLGLCDRHREELRG